MYYLKIVILAWLQSMVYVNSYKNIAASPFLDQANPFFSHTFQQTLSKSGTVSHCIWGSSLSRFLTLCLWKRWETILWWDISLQLCVRLECLENKTGSQLARRNANTREQMSQFPPQPSTQAVCSCLDCFTSPSLVIGNSAPEIFSLRPFKSFYFHLIRTVSQSLT